MEQDSIRQSRGLLEEIEVLRARVGALESEIETKKGEQ
jgi:hypothetical protein